MSCALDAERDLVGSVLVRQQNVLGLQGYWEGVVQGKSRELYTRITDTSIMLPVAVLDRRITFLGRQILIVRHDASVCVTSETSIQIEYDCLVVPSKSGPAWRVDEMVLQSVCSPATSLFKLYTLCTGAVSGAAFPVKVHEGDIFDDKVRELWQFYTGSRAECVASYFQFQSLTHLTVTDDKCVFNPGTTPWGVGFVGKNVLNTSDVIIQHLEVVHLNCPNFDGFCSTHIVIGNE